MSNPSTPKFDVEAARVVGADAWLERRLAHPEDVAVTREGMLFCGGENGELYRVDPASGGVDIIGDTGGFVLGVEIGPEGDLYACDFQQHAVFRLQLDGVRPVGDLETVVSGGPDEPPLHPNYLVFDREGRLYVTDSGSREKLPGPFEDSGGCVYVVEPDGEGHVLTDEVSAFPNGLALSADGDTLYVCESGTHEVSALSLRDGRVTGVELVTDECGMVDGLALDADDRLYVASIGDNAIYRYDGSDTELLVQDTNGMTVNNPTNVAFGGEEMRTMYVANLGLWHITAFDIETEGRHPTARRET